MIAATGSFSDPLFAAVFQPQNPIPLTRFRLHLGDASDLGTIQGMNAKAKSEGLILHWAASYGDTGNAGFAAIWVPNTGHVLWSNDGLLEHAGTYQARFNAETFDGEHAAVHAKPRQRGIPTPPRRYHKHLARKGTGTARQWIACGLA
jgi:hypothetical protein